MANFCNVKKFAMEERLFNELLDEALFSNLQKITCIILRNLFGLDLFSHQSCATGTLLLRK